jgi:hypothetical protein
VYSAKTAKQTQTLPAAPYPNSVEIDSNDHLIGGVELLNGNVDGFIYNQKGFLLKKLKRVYYEWPGSMKPSGDATRLISISGGKVGACFRNM